MTGEAAGAAAPIRLNSDAYFASPYSVYERIRAEAPVYWSDEVERWLLLRHEDVLRAFRAREFTTRLSKPGLFRHWFTYMDGDDHARLRKGVNAHFATPSAKAQRARIGELTDALLDEVLQKKGPVDFMEAFANPLPVKLIASAIGLPLQDGPLLVKWTTDITAAKGLAVAPETKFQSVESFHAMIRYLRDFVADFREAEGGASVTSDLLRGYREGWVSGEELPATLMLLILATIETTSSLMGNGLLALLENPGEREKLEEDPGLLRNAVEEMLRYDAPAQFINRTACEDVEIGGATIRAGQSVLAIIGAANRDPEVFADPHRFCIERPNAAKHLSFGGGAHFCAGAPLARETAAVVFERLLPHLGRFELAGPADAWQRITLMFRRLEHLPVEVR